LWVVATVAGLAALFIIVLCVPLGITLRLDVYGRPKFRLKLTWLFGLVSRQVSKGKKKPGKKEKPEEKEVMVEGRPKTKRRKGEAKLIFNLLRTKGLPRKIINLVTGIFRPLKIGDFGADFRDFGADFRIGLDNPADTGLLFAAIGPAFLLLSSAFPHRMRMQPSFADDALFEGHLHGTLRLRPIQLIIPVLGLVFSLPAFRAMKTLAWSKWKRKR
jgi:hypothetical protein